MHLAMQGIKWKFPTLAPDQKYSRKLRCAVCRKDVETITTKGPEGWVDKKIHLTRMHANSHLTPYWNCPLCVYKSNKKANVKCNHLKMVHKDSTAEPVLSITKVEYDAKLKAMADKCFPSGIERCIETTERI